MFLSALHRINPGRIDRTVSQKIRQPHDIFIRTVILSGEQMSQIVRINLVGADSRQNGQTFHIIPYIYPIQRIAVSRAEYRTAVNFFILCVILQEKTEFSGQNDYPLFSFAADARPSALHRFHGSG